MNLTKQQLYPSLRKLKNKGLINATSNRPAVFTALPVEKVLDLLADSKIKDAENTKQNKKEILQIWKLMVNKAQDKYEG
jgi:sugar-specific transcriptional regulator TrmB